MLPDGSYPNVRIFILLFRPAYFVVVHIKTKKRMCIVLYEDAAVVVVLPERLVLVVVVALVTANR